MAKGCSLNPAVIPVVCAECDGVACIYHPSHSEYVRYTIANKCYGESYFHE